PPTTKLETQFRKPAPPPHTTTQAQDAKRPKLTPSTQPEPTNSSAIPTTRSPATEPDQQPTHIRPQQSTQPRTRNRIQKFSKSTTMSQRPRHRNALSTRNNYTHQTVERKIGGSDVHQGLVPHESADFQGQSIRLLPSEN